MSLRNKLIRLAFEQPQLRDDILPLITKSASIDTERWGMWSELLKRSGLIVEIERNPMPMYDTELKVFYSRHRKFHNVDALTGDIYATIGYDRGGSKFTVTTGNKSEEYNVWEEKNALKDLVRYFKSNKSASIVSELKKWSQLLKRYDLIAEVYPGTNELWIYEKSDQGHSLARLEMSWSIVAKVIYDNTGDFTLEISLGDSGEYGKNDVASALRKILRSR